MLRASASEIAQATAGLHRAFRRARGAKLAAGSYTSLDMGPVYRTLLEQGHGEGAIWMAIEDLSEEGYLEWDPTHPRPRNWYYHPTPRPTAPQESDAEVV